ncbi:hypothetical protein JZ751_008703 [Albula glossodonta]|uniref:Uncharacterized protein n=1 Tax=Albula glossodonta TaxID=121402 RepID=A0A8T2NZP9_9TELE|nr:hypothetical protein JZ751_008703 [Albula glossodonta]
MEQKRQQLLQTTGTPPPPWDSLNLPALHRSHTNPREDQRPREGDLRSALSWGNRWGDRRVPASALNLA